jgi:hypothetical protein
MNKLVLSFALILIPLAGNAQVAVWKNCTQETIVQSANGEIERFTVFDTPDKFEEKSWHILTFVRQPILSKDWSPKTNPENQFRWSLRYSEQIQQEADLLREKIRSLFPTTQDNCSMVLCPRVNKNGIVQEVEIKLNQEQRPVWLNTQLLSKILLPHLEHSILAVFFVLLRIYSC